jgi:hypothetical protein
MIKRAFQFDKPFGDDVKVYGGCFYGCMPEKSADGVKIRSPIKGVGCKRVTEAVDTAVSRYTGFFLAL